MEKGFLTAGKANKFMIYACKWILWCRQARVYWRSGVPSGSGNPGIRCLGVSGDQGYHVSDFQLKITINEIITLKIV